MKRFLKRLLPQLLWSQRLKQSGLVLMLGFIAGCEVIDQIAPSLPQFDLPPLGPIAAPDDRSPNQSPDHSPNGSPNGSTNPSAAQSTQTGQMESQVREQINQIRQQQGLAPLRQNDQLAEVARNYSRRMAEEDFFAHVSPKGDTLSDRVDAAGVFYFMIGENLFTSTNIADPVPASVKGWMNSPGHRENILRSEFRETGIGVWRQGNTYYFTQLFLRSFR